MLNSTLSLGIHFDKSLFFPEDFLVSIPRVHTVEVSRQATMTSIFLLPIQQGSCFARPLNNPKVTVSLHVLTLIFPLYCFENGFEVSTYIFGISTDPFTAIILALYGMST